MSQSTHQQIHERYGWFGLRLALAVESESDEPATLARLAREVGLPAAEARALLEGLQQAGFLECDGAGPESTYRATGSPTLPPPVPAPVQKPPVSPSRAVAAELLTQYRLLFEQDPSIPWLMRQRRRALAIGEDILVLLKETRYQRPDGNPQAYLEGLLRRRERAHAERRRLRLA